VLKSQKVTNKERPLSAIPKIRTSQEHAVRQRDPIYLFACHLEWRCERNMRAYQELVAARDERDIQIRDLAETLLHRSSPPPAAQEG
jgi:hypothetical protein